MKKGTKLLSVLLAFVMVLSAFAATFAASAADVYKPVYSEDVTEEDVELLIGDINTLIEKNLLTGANIEAIYKALPSLSSILNLGGSSTSSDTGAFYKAADPERFADLPDGKFVADELDEEGNIVKDGTLTAFFKEHPIVCNNAADFQKELNAVIDTVVVENLLQTIIFAFALGGDLEAAKELCTGLDELCQALGVEQEKTASEVLGFDTFQGDVAGTRTYLKNIVAAVLPDPANSVLSIVRRLAADENGALLYSGATKVLNSLDAVITSLSGSLGSLIDLAAVQAKIAEINATFAALPTVGDGETKRLDIEGVVAYLVSSLTDDALTITFVDREENPVSTRALLAIKFRHMKLDRVANAESTADVLKIIYDYLYDNLIADDANNALIKMALDLNIIENALRVDIPKDVKDFIYKALKMDNLELADALIVMVANAAGRELPEEPTTEEPTTEKPTTEPTTKPSTTKPADETTTKPAQNNNNNADKNVDIPKTGSAATIGFSALSVAAGAAFITLVARRKK